MNKKSYKYQIWAERRCGRLLALELQYEHAARGGLAVAEFDENTIRFVVNYFVNGTGE